MALGQSELDRLTIKLIVFDYFIGKTIAKLYPRNVNNHSVIKGSIQFVIIHQWDLSWLTKLKRNIGQIPLLVSKWIVYYINYLYDIRGCIRVTYWPEYGIRGTTRNKILPGRYYQQFKDEVVSYCRQSTLISWLTRVNIPSHHNKIQIH